jgi:hypothetical protein
MAIRDAARRGMAVAVVLFARLCGSAAETPVGIQVSDLASSPGVDRLIGVEDSGKHVAGLLVQDLGVLNSVAVSRADPGAALAGGFRLSGALVEMGVDVRVDLTLAAPALQRSLSVSDHFGPSRPLSDALSHLSLQLATFALESAGRSPPNWGSAQLLGSRRAGSGFSYGTVCCVLSVDGVVIRDEVDHWGETRILEPGLHEIFVRYYDGSRMAGYGLVLVARPGARYQTRCSEAPDGRVKLWIQDVASGEPATATVDARISGNDHWYDGTFHAPPPFVPAYVGAGNQRAR